MQEDNASRGLGMTLERCRLRAHVDEGARGHGHRPRDLPRRTDLHPRRHTFAFACNSYNDVAVAQGANIEEFLAPGKLGDVLTAIGEERHQEDRAGVLDIRKVSNGRPRLRCRGTSASAGTVEPTQEEKP